MNVRGLFLTMLVASAASPAAAASNITLISRAFQNPGPNTDVVVATRISPADGVTSIDLAYTYDPALLAPDGAFKTAYANGFTLTSDLATAGLARLRLTSETPLTGSGEVAWLVFRVIGGAGTTVPLGWVSASLNGGTIPASAIDGTVVIQAGTVTIAAPDDANGLSATQVVVPLTATPFTGGGAIDLAVTFNQNVIGAASVAKTALTSCLTLAANTAVPGSVTIALYGTCTVAGSGDLVRITFNVVGPIGSRTPINVIRGAINEGAIGTVLDDGMFTVCDAVDRDGDGFSGCAGDCDDSNPDVRPGAPETCNGIDDDCDGTLDNAPPPPGTPALFVMNQPVSGRLAWSDLPGATSYDLLRGDLGVLHASRGDFTSATDTCLASGSTDTSAIDILAPPSNEGFWYLVRARNCSGPGTYDTGSLSQVGLRDAGISRATGRCP